MLWQTLSFAELSTAQLYELLQLRVDVFVVEQSCPYPELDGKDCLPATLHLLGTDSQGKLQAYARLVPPGVSYPELSIGRVVVAANARGQGHAQQLMQQAIAECARVWPQQAITIGAQQYLLAFYQSFGFKCVSTGYLEDGIPHIDMRRDSL
ncbi:GNAT family N-acetyltransferase [Shewanella sp.]|uniref:GNAT family N-acetyltransferase n=1 Tax=Shewanella sp. TaxID=50422 RepID=UPI003A97C28B